MKKLKTDGLNLAPAAILDKKDSGIVKSKEKVVNRKKWEIIFYDKKGKLIKKKYTYDKKHIDKIIKVEKRRLHKLDTITTNAIYCSEKTTIPLKTESIEFYNLMREYRHVSVDNQDARIKAFDEVKKWINENYNEI